MDTTTTTRDKIIDCVIARLKEHGQPHPTAYALCRELNISEKDFYAEFPSIEAVEAAHWRNVMDHNILQAERTPEWSSYNAQQRLLAFYYTYFDDALCHRTLLLARARELTPLRQPVFFAGASERFLQFARAILKQAVADKQIADRGRLNDLYPQALLLQFRSVLDFYLRDTSQGFEKTDALIEKSTRLIFDLMQTSALESAIDLARWALALRQGADFAQTTCGTR